MSYRLINSNAIAIKYPEVNEMPCIFADLPDGLHGQFIDVHGQEVRHAEWLHEQLALPLSDGSKECVRCSSCLTHWDNESNYCPNCGADMRGEKTSAQICKMDEKKKTDEILSDTPNHPEVEAPDEDWANDWMSG